MQTGNRSQERKQVRVLVHGLNFVPEVTGIAPYTTSMARALSDEGFAVDVITGFPHYPQWRRDPAVRGIFRAETMDGVRVTRVWHPVPRKPSALRRVWLELIFGMTSILAIRCRYDVVVCVSPALISSAMVSLWTRIFSPRTRRIFWFQDLYGVGLSEMGSARQAGVARLFSGLERLLAGHADGVAAIHQRFFQHLFAGHDSSTTRRAVVVPNWTHVDESLFASRDQEFNLRAEIGIPDDAVLVGHFGNMGRKQALGSIVSAGRVSSDGDGPPVHFVLVGDGSERVGLERDAVGVGSVHFVDSLGADDFLPAMRSVDVLLVNEGAGVREMCVPSKLTSYYAAERPIVAACNADGLTAQEVEKVGAGLVVPPESPSALLEAVRTIAEDRELERRLSAAGISSVRNVDSYRESVRRFVELINETHSLV